MATKQPSRNAPNHLGERCFNVFKGDVARIPYFRVSYQPRTLRLIRQTESNSYYHPTPQIILEYPSIEVVAKMTRRPRRRTVVRSAFALLAGSVAGCLGTGSGDDGTDEPGTTTTPETTTPETTTQSTETTVMTTDTDIDEQPTVEEFLSQTDNFDGIEDRTGADTVDIEVGVEANGAFYGFRPPAVRIDQGTTVTWTWTGQGSTHNVVARHGAEFESEQSSEAGHTFQQSFEEPGTVLYVCVPHEGVGMKGAIVVD